MTRRRLDDIADEFMIINRRWFSECENQLYGKEFDHDYVLSKFTEYLAYRMSFRCRFKRLLIIFKPSTNNERH